MTKSCVFIGGKQIGVNCLRQLLEKDIRPQLVIGNLDDDGVDTWHESLIKTALQHNLQTIIQTKVREPKTIELIKELNPEIIFCIGGMQIIPWEFLKLGCLNIHPALLPKYRGRYSTAHAIFNGDPYTGVTIHWMDEGVDSGPIIMQKRIEIEEADTARSLYDKVLTEGGGELFAKFLNLWLNGKEIPSTVQNESEATYYPKELPGKGEIDPKWDKEKIKRFIRAMAFEPLFPLKKL